MSAGLTVETTFFLTTLGPVTQDYVKSLEESVGADLDRVELERVMARVKGALELPTCAGLFHGGSNPAQVLDDLVHGRIASSKLEFKDLGPPRTDWWMQRSRQAS